MACRNSDSEIFPKLAEHSKKLMKLEEYLSFVIESTQYWHESKYMLKNEIREIFSALSSVLHQREMQLYRQVDELRIDLNSPTLNMSHENALEHDKNSLKSSCMPKKFLSRPCVSPPLKLKFQADIRSLEEAIHSFGCLEIEDGSISEDSNYIYVNNEDGLSVEDESLHRSNIGQNGSGNKTEAHSDGSLDSFEILPDSEVSVPWSKKISDVCPLSLRRKSFEQNGVPNQTGSPSVTSSNSSVFTGALPDNKSPVAWLRKEIDHDADVCSSSSLNVDSDIRVRRVSGSSSMLSHPAVSNGNGQWLKKSDESESSSATVTPKDIASVLSFTDAFKVKEKIPVEDFSKLSSHLRSTGTSENNKNGATGSSALSSTVKNGNLCLTVNVSDTVPDFRSVIGQMLGNGNDGWLGSDRSGIGQPLSKHNYKEAITGTMKQNSILCLDRTPFQMESLPSNIINTDKSNSPAVSISKMFSPYFKNQDKSNWLVKNNTNSKRFNYS